MCPPNCLPLPDRNQAGLFKPSPEKEPSPEKDTDPSNESVRVLMVYVMLAVLAGVLVGALVWSHDESIASSFVAGIAAAGFVLTIYKALS